MTATSGQPVVVGLDRSEAGRAAVEHAAELAVQRGQPLHLVRAFQPSQFPMRHRTGLSGDIDDLLRKAAGRLVDETSEVLSLVYPTLQLSAELAPGSPAETLIGESREAAFLVVGSRGSGGFSGLVIGSTTLRVATHAHCPVVAVPATPADDPPRAGVVVGVDGTDVSEEAIDVAFQSASETDEQLMALHAWSDPAQTGHGVLLPLVYDPVTVNQEEQRVMAESMARWSEKYPNVTVVSRVVRDHPVRALVRAAEHARLLVVGSHGRGPVSGALLGSVSHGVLHHATGPVVVARHRSLRSPVPTERSG